MGKMQSGNIFRKHFLPLIMILGSMIIFNTSLVYAEEISQESSLANGLAWLEQNQDNNGSWGIDTTAFVATGEVSGYLREHNLSADNLQKSVAWAENQAILNNDMAARLLPLIQNADKHAFIKNALLAGQNQDGGWGIAQGYESDILDTLIVMDSLTNEAGSDTAMLQKAVSYIINRQHANGSWSFNNDQDSVIFLTAQAVIALSSFQTKTNLTNCDLQTALRKAGEYLVSVQQADKTWGLDEEAIAGTLLSYRAVIATVGLAALDNADKVIINAQNSDGSWYGNPYLTALALKAIKSGSNIPEAAIQSIKLLRDIDGTPTECYGYKAFETFEIQTEGTYNTAEAELLTFVKQKDGSVVTAQTDGLPGWNTQNSLPGDYAVIVQVRDKASGRILAAAEKTFVITPSFQVCAIIVATDPKDTIVDQAVEVRTEATVITEGNIDQTLNLKLTITKDGGEVKTETKTLLCKTEGSITRVEFGPFTPDVAAVCNYTLKVEAFNGDNNLAEGETVFEVKTTPPPTRIDATQSLSKAVLYPGMDTVSAQFKLTGEGTPGTTPRKPIDLILILDSSGSMVGKPWTKTKEAASNIVDFIQAEDRCAVVGFSSSAWIQINLTSDKSQIKQSITGMPYKSGGTAMELGLKKGFDVVANTGSDRQLVFILLSDGNPNSQSAVYSAVSTAIQKGISIYTLGLGNGVNARLLQDIANKTGGIYKYSPTPQELSAMMTELAGEIFDTAGQNVVLETTLPVGSLTVDPCAIVPAPAQISDNADGSKTLQWTLEQLLMGEEKIFTLNYSGTDLIADTSELLTKNTKLTYQDQNGAAVTLTIPDLEIPVSKYLLDSAVTTDKTAYTANEQVSITNITKNLTEYPCNLSGKIEILDSEGALVQCLANEAAGSWQAGETKTLTFTLNSGTTMTGSYKARVTWYEGTKVVSIAQAGFLITADAGVSVTATAGKQEYTADEDVNISVTIKNNSTNQIVEGLRAVATISSADGTVVWSTEKNLPEILPVQQTDTNIFWNTTRNAPGRYTLTIEVYEGTTKLAENSTVITIVSSVEGISGISGSLEVGQKNIYPADGVNFTCTLRNTGNVALNNLTSRLRIVDTATETVLGTICDQINLEISASETLAKVWSHESLETGTYMVVLDTVLADGTEVPLASSYLKVENPYETILTQVVRPRVLVWAESQGNINLAQTTLDEMQVYYTVVNTREDFMSELRTGKYNLYMLLDSKLPLIGDDDLELAAEVAGGKGIIATMDANGDNLKNLGVNGVKYTGNAILGNFSVDFPADSAFGAITLNGAGKIQKVVLEGGTQAAALQEIATTATYPGVITYDYQNGKSVLFTFDLGSCTGDTQSILKTAVEKVVPATETNSGLAELEIKVTAQTAIGAQIQLNIPQDSQIIWVTPVTETKAWQFETATGQEYTFRVLLRLPVASGQYPVTADAYYETVNGMLKFDTAEIQVSR